MPLARGGPIEYTSARCLYPFFLQEGSLHRRWLPPIEMAANNTTRWRSSQGQNCIRIELTPGVFCRFMARSSPSAMPADELAFRLWSILRHHQPTTVFPQTTIMHDNAIYFFTGRSRERREGEREGKSTSMRGPVASRDASMMKLVGAKARTEFLFDRLLPANQARGTRYARARVIKRPNTGRKADTKKCSRGVCGQTRTCLQFPASSLQLNRFSKG